MNKDVLQAFEILHEMDRPASPSSRAFPIQSPRYWFATALAESKIIRYRWHDNRHTFCSRLAMRGESMKVIQQLAGHKTIQMSARYAHLGEKNLRTAVEGLSTARGCMALQRSAPIQNDPYIARLRSMVLRAIIISDGHRVTPNWELQRYRNCDGVYKCQLPL